MFYFEQGGTTFSEFNANLNSFYVKAVPSIRATELAMCEGGLNAAGTLLSERSGMSGVSCN